MTKTVPLTVTNRSRSPDPLTLPDMPCSLASAAFLNTSEPMLDVRSPAEYEQGHIPGAISFPLFSNEERAQVGTCYKQEGRDEAVELGLAIVGPKMQQFVQQAKHLAPDRQLRLHCWRGGMRSGSMAWLLETAGFQVNLLEGGYKAYRQWVRTALAASKPILLIGGMTGTGKTAILAELACQGQQILDLEALANHRGSSYGGLGLPPQPSTEHFENLVALHWAGVDPDRPVWIEAESHMVGTCRVPDELFQQMMMAPMVLVERSRTDRIEFLLEGYGTVDRAELIAATNRLRKRLGGERTQAAIESIQQDNLAAAISIVLDYYDKTYLHDLQRRNGRKYSIDAVNLSVEASAKLLLQQLAKVNSKLNKDDPSLMGFDLKQTSRSC